MCMCVLPFLALRVGITTDSLNKPWTEGKNIKGLAQQLVKSSSTISCQRVYRCILAGASNANLTGVPSPQILLATWVHWEISKREAISKLELNYPPFKKKNLGNIIASNLYKNVSITTENFCPTWHEENTSRLSPLSTLAGLTVGIADIPVVDDKAEIIWKNHTNV